MQMVTPLIAGNAQVTLIATVSPDAAHFQDTCNTLRLASRATSIKNCLVRNIVRDQDVQMLSMWHALPAEVRFLACLPLFQTYYRVTVPCVCM